jgi:hypothetical protein
LAEEDEFEDYDVSMFNSKALEEETKQSGFKSGEKIIPKAKPKETKKTFYNTKLLLIAPPGLLSTKPMEIINQNFIYKASKSLNTEILSTFSVPSPLPPLYHVYSIDDSLITNIPLLTAADPSLTVILFGFTAKHVSNTIGQIKDGAFDGFTGIKPAEINALLQ